VKSPTTSPPPDKDNKGNTIPCFHDYGFFRPAAYPQVRESVELYEHFTILKDTKGNVLEPEPLLGPIVYITLLVPASTSLRDGTVEKVMLDYMPEEADRVTDDLVRKFGASHPPEKRLSPKMEEWLGVKLISREAWETGWGELFLAITEKDVSVIATTSKLTRFERENKKDEF
jgi:hypothetical protein